MDDQQFKVFTDEATALRSNGASAGDIEAHRLAFLAKVRPNPMEAIGDMMVTKEAVDQFESPEFIILDLLIKTHILALCGKPGSGKTSILMYLCSQMVKAGYKVVYFNYDISSGDFKRDYQMAVDGGFTLIADVDKNHPRPAESIITMLIRLIENPDADMSRHVFIFDTLKKFTDVMCKARMKDFMTLCRRATNKGATVVLPCHAKKYLDPEGFPVFDGVGDLQNDTDELLYLIPKEDEDGGITVSVEVGETGKTRGKINPRTFRISDRREVSEVGYVDVVQDMAEEKQLTEDADYIKTVINAIHSKCCTESAIVTYCANNPADEDNPMSRRKTISILKKYNHGTDGPVRWYSQRGMANNSWNYGLEPL